MTDILLIQPPIQDFYLTKKRTIPYGLTAIAAVLIQKGFSVDIFDSLATKKSRIQDFPIEMAFLKEFYGRSDCSPFALFHHFRHFGYTYGHIGKIVKNSGAYLVGISSLFTAYYETALKTAEIVKQFSPDSKIVLGGHHPTAMPVEAMDNRVVDFLIRGEGEVSMPSLAQALRTGKEMTDIPGIVFRNKDGSLHINPPAAMPDPNQYPLPAMHLVKQQFYQRKKSGSTVMVTSRGCPMKCSYCSVGASGLPYRRRSVASVVKEMELAVFRDHAGFIDFEDENLSLNKKWFINLLTKIRSRFGHLEIELRAMNGLFPPTLDEEVVGQMKRAGFKTLNLSLGSTSSSQLQKFSRVDVRNYLEQAIRFAEQIGLETVSYIIAGAPGQKPSDSIKDLLYLAGKNTIAAVSIFYPAPGSPDFEKCRKLGILPDNLSLMRSSAFPISHTTNRIEAVTILRLGRLLNFIKFLKNKGVNLPDPSPYQGQDLSEIEDREEKGLFLLSWFLSDGHIRGITTGGDVFTHITDEKLVHQFISGLSVIL